MSNIYNAFNVKNDKELTELIESFNLDINEEAELYSALNEDMSVDGIRYIINDLTKKFDNGSYEKLQEQLAKPSFKRVLKERINRELDPNVIENFWKEIINEYKNIKYNDDYDDDTLVDLYNKVYVFLEIIANKYFSQPNNISSEADGIGDYYDDEVVSEFKDEAEHGIITYFGRYESSQHMLDNAENGEFFSILQSQAKRRIVEDLVKDVVSFCHNTELFDIEDETSTRKLKDSGKEWIEEAVNSDLERLIYAAKEFITMAEEDLPEGNTHDIDFECWRAFKLLEKISKKFSKVKEEYKEAINILMKKMEECEFILSMNTDWGTEQAKQWIERRILDGKYDELIDRLNFDVKIELRDLVLSKCKKVIELYDAQDENKVNAPKESGEEFMENYDATYDPVFDIGDNVSFEWGDEKLTGRVIKVKRIGKNEYYDIVSYNTKEKRRETYITVCPISNDMKKIYEGDL